MFLMTIRPKRCGMRQCVSKPAPFLLIPDCFGTQEMYERAVDGDPWSLIHVPNYFKTKVVCDYLVCEDSYSIKCVPN